MILKILIIDSHTHIGTIPYQVGKNRVSDLKKDDLLSAMDKYGIDLALASSIEGAEFDSDFQLADGQASQVDSGLRLIQSVKNNPKLKALLWIKPYTEGCNVEFENLVRDNLEQIAGLKIHPSLSHLKFTDEKFYSYLELADRYDLPILVHTENDGYSDLHFVYEVAKNYPDLIFVMAHLGLNTDHFEAMDLISEHPNLYGDTAEMETNAVLKAVRKCGSRKILFGTDAVVHGVETYARYRRMIETIKKSFSKEETENVLANNCRRIFGV